MQILKPLGNRVVVKRSAHAQTKGGILLPESSQDKPKSGVVIAVGPGKKDDKGSVMPMHVKVGDKVLFSSFGGSLLEFGEAFEEPLLVLAEDDILGIIG